MRSRTVWEVVDDFGEYEDAFETIHAAFTCPIVAALCAKRHGDRMRALGDDECFWDYNFTFTRAVGVKECKRGEF